MIMGWQFCLLFETDLRTISYKKLTKYAEKSLTTMQHV